MNIAKISDAFRLWTGLATPYQIMMENLWGNDKIFQRYIENNVTTKSQALECMEFLESSIEESSKSLSVITEIGNDRDQAAKGIAVKVFLETAGDEESRVRIGTKAAQILEQTDQKRNFLLDQVQEKIALFRERQNIIAKRFGLEASKTNIKSLLSVGLQS